MGCDPDYEAVSTAHKMLKELNNDINLSLRETLLAKNVIAPISMAQNIVDQKMETEVKSAK